MREIKFRAWDKEENRMIYSDEKLPYDAWFSLDNGTVHCLINYAYCDSFGDEHDDWQPLDNIMPYTGLKDKNGVEIYEGDIVKDNSGLFGNVVYSSEEYDGIAGFMVFDVYDGLQNRDGFWHLIEVIGNIYENPTLLEATT